MRTYLLKAAQPALLLAWCESKVKLLMAQVNTHAVKFHNIGLHSLPPL